MAAERAGGGGGKVRKDKKRAVSDHDFVAGTSYAPAPESTAAVSLEKRYGLFIGGKWVKGGKPLKTRNPSHWRDPPRRWRQRAPRRSILL